MEDRIFENLNDKQVEAVKATEGRVRVIAGAGSGKTRVLANRYAYIVEELGIDPAHVLCMTFTNKAAQEMRQRIKKLVTPGYTNDYICTIHGLCVRILRKEIYRLGFPRKFMIIDTEDSKELMKQVATELNLSRNVITINQLLQNLRHFKNSSKLGYVPFFLPGQELPNDEVNLRYIQLQKKFYAIDFDDLIYFTLYILKKYPDACEYWQNEFHYIQIDEVQDCSGSDWMIIDALTGKCKNLFIVGDPDQAIYEWRGALPATFVNFKADTDIILNENYRSTPNILDVANSVIKNNKYRIEKELKTQIPSDAIVIYKHAKSEVEEGQWIAETIERLLKDGHTSDEFGILYRASNLSRFVEQALMTKHISYTIWGGVRFFERKEIKDCLAYLRILNNRDDLSFRRIINVPQRKFGEAKYKALEKIAEEEKVTLYDALTKHKLEKPFNGEQTLDFVNTIESLTQMVDKLSISDLLEEVLSSTGLGDMYRKDGDEDRLENLKELMNSIKYYEESHQDEDITLEKYLQDIALYTNNDYQKDSATVKLMTIHQAKGLEFPYIFIVGLTEGVFPSHRTIRDRKLKGLEEERRLMYVAITRAEKALFLSESEGYNFTTRTAKFPSRFISEISDTLLAVDGVIDKSLVEGSKSLVKTIEAQMFGHYDITCPFAINDKVCHISFGEGRVVEIDQDKQSCKVEFEDKTLFVLWYKLMPAKAGNDDDQSKQDGEDIENILKSLEKDIDKESSVNSDEPLEGISKDLSRSNSNEKVNNKETLVETLQKSALLNLDPAFKNILILLESTGYIDSIIVNGKWNSSVNNLHNIIEKEYAIKNNYADYVIRCIAYKLGYIPAPPVFTATQSKVSQQGTKEKTIILNKSYTELCHWQGEKLASYKKAATDYIESIIELKGDLNKEFGADFKLSSIYEVFLNGAKIEIELEINGMIKPTIDSISFTIVYYDKNNKIIKRESDYEYDFSKSYKVIQLSYIYEDDFQYVGNISKIVIYWEHRYKDE